MSNLIYPREVECPACEADIPCDDAVKSVECKCGAKLRMVHDCYDGSFWGTPFRYAVVDRRRRHDDASEHRLVELTADLASRTKGEWNE